MRGERIAALQIPQDLVGRGDRFVDRRPAPIARIEQLVATGSRLQQGDGVLSRVEESEQGAGVPSPPGPVQLNLAVPDVRGTTDAFDRIGKLTGAVRRRSRGAGHTQIIQAGGSHGRVYVDESRCKDWSWSTRLHKTRSDVQFRSRCGGATQLPQWFTAAQIHLNHHRDNQFGRHLEEQR